jgi:hypothetical protein
VPVVSTARARIARVGVAIVKDLTREAWIRPAETVAEEPPTRLKVLGGLTRCPFCHADVDVAGADWVACKGCLARHHLACWGESGACATCGLPRFLPAASTTRAKRSTRGLRVVAGVAIAALALVVAFDVRKAESEREDLAVRCQELERRLDAKAAEPKKADETPKPFLVDTPIELRHRPQSASEWWVTELRYDPMTTWRRIVEIVLDDDHVIDPGQVGELRRVLLFAFDGVHYYRYDMNSDEVKRLRQAIVKLAR